MPRVGDLAHRAGQRLVVDLGGVAGELVEDGAQPGGHAHGWAPEMISRRRAASAATSGAPVMPLPTMMMRGPSAR